MTLMQDLTLSGDTDENIKYNKENGWPDLTPIQRAFGFQFLVCRSPRKAAEEVGMSPNRGAVWLRNPLVSAFVQYLQEAQAIRFGIDADFAMMEMLESLDKFKGEEAINMIDRDGMEISGKKFHPEQYLGIMKEFNKVAGLYKDSKANQGSVSINMDFGALGLSLDQAKGITIEGKRADEDFVPL